LKPKLKFSNWIPWEDRNEYPYVKCPGVYMLTVSEKKLSDKTADLAMATYIGMTDSRGGLGLRWRQLNRSICDGSRGHSGGRTIFNRLGSYVKWKRKLFVSACPVRCTVEKTMRTPSDLIQMGWVAYLEYEALAKFKELTGDEPEFNTK
jgi:hypothetical protein